MAQQLPVVIPIRDEDTPWSDDPPDANIFYANLGIAMVAWSRLEGQVVLDLIQIRSLPGTKVPFRRFPISWKKKAEVWRSCFNEMTCLQHLRPRGLAIISEIMNCIGYRHWLSHAMWRDFDLPENPLAIRSIGLNASDVENQGDVELKETTVSVGDLLKTTEVANRLNRELLLLTRELAAIRPLAPLEARRV